MKFKLQRKFIPEVGTYFIYESTVYKIVKVENEQLWFAWYDKDSNKVLTNESVNKYGMSQGAWEIAIKSDKYKIYSPDGYQNYYLHPLLREFKLE